MSKVVAEAGIENIYDAIPTNGRGTKLWWFQFGAYGDTYVFVWGGSLEDALEEAAGWLADNAPGLLTSEKEMAERFQEEAEDQGVSWPPEDWDDPEVESVREAAEADMTYTESGWIPSWEWYVNELHPGDELYAEVWEATIDRLAEEDALGDREIEEVNKFAEKHDIDAEWEMDDEVENPSEGEVIGGDYHDGPMQRDEEHGQEWLTCVGCGAQWSIVDTNRGEDYEQVSEGDGSCEDND